MMTTTTLAQMNEIEDASTARWLAEKLASARIRVSEAPTAEAVDRIRLRVLGETAPKKERIAA
jgi:hypothetical protein